MSDPNDAYEVQFSTYFHSQSIPVCGGPVARWRRAVLRATWLPWWLWQFGADRCGRTDVSLVGNVYRCPKHGGSSESTEQT